MPKECNKCHIIYEDVKSSFYSCKPCKDGYVGVCRVCKGKQREELIKRIGKEEYKARHLINSNNAIKARREKGMCRSCKNPSLPNSKYCETHWFRQVSWNALKSRKYADFLKDLWIKQNKKCVYTDEELFPGVNMSLDHIISKYANSSLSEDPNNVQWVTKDVNWIKNFLTHEQFVALCKHIAKKFS